MNQRTSQAGSSSCQCLTTLYGMQQESMNHVKQFKKSWRIRSKDFFAHRSFLGPGSEKKWYGTCDCIPSGFWSRTAEKMLLNFAGSGHPIFRCTSVLERGELLRSRGGGKTSIHFNGRTQNIELLIQIVISVNQLSLCGASADMIEEQPVGQRAPGKPLHQINWINKKFLHNLLSQKCKPMKSNREAYCKITSNDLRNCQNTTSYPSCARKQV